MERIGVFFAVIGSFLVANGIYLAGYIAFFFSSTLLSITAYKKQQYNLLVLQLTFLIANLNGLIRAFL